MEKPCRKFSPKASPRPLFYFGKQPKAAITCKKSIWKQDILKGDYQKYFKKLTLLFLSNLVGFNGQSFQNQKGQGTSDQLLFWLRNKFIKTSLLVTYHLNKLDGVI